MGKFLIEELARLPVEVDVASEFHYRNPILAKNDLVVGTTQSGETADTPGVLRRVSTPKTERAVAQACAANPLAVATPCHRVVRQDGALSGLCPGFEKLQSGGRIADNRAAAMALSPRDRLGAARAPRAGTDMGDPAVGPMAIPGEYVVELRVGATVLTRPLSIEPDPRVTIAGTDPGGRFSISIRDAIHAALGDRRRDSRRAEQLENARSEWDQTLRGDVAEWNERAKALDVPQVSLPR